VNISQMMRGLLGEVTNGETRAMELKVGQVVRGVVLQALDNNEAIVGINGVQVRAKLEMALQPGQSAMLQVQPETNGSLILLKAVDLNTSGLLDDTFREYAKLLGLPDQKWALALIRGLRQEGFAFNRTTAMAFQQAAAALPKGADAEQWMTAAATAFKRGMPMTATTISSLQQVMFGKPAHELLDQLQRQLTGMGATASGDVPETGAGSESRTAASRVLALLQQGASLLDDALSPHGSTPSNTSGRPAADGGMLHVDGRSAGKGAATAEGGANGTSGADGRTAQADSGAAAARAAQGSAQSNWLGQLMKWMGVDHELQLAKAATDTNGQASAAPGSKNLAAGDGDANAVSARTGQASGEAAAAGRNAVTAPSGSGHSTTAQPTAQNMAVPQTTNQLQQAMTPRSGAETPAGTQVPAGAQETAAAVRVDGQGAAVAARMAGMLAADGPIGNDLNVPAQGQTSTPPSGGVGTESLKSALMLLAGGADTPPHVKETAQQLIGQITGQQLLLAPERNNSVFTHVTMFIPLKDASGEQTASVQIQTRRGRRGELDADNCRLLFNLSMRTLGDTLVDVHITDKIVSLQLWNDHPAIAQLTDGSRETLTERLNEMGYQLSSIRTKPLVRNESDGSEPGTASGSAKGSKSAAPPSEAWLTAARYKGVDYRA
jgi:hypothetical protein